MKQLVILGAGSAGTMMANRLAHRLPDDWRLTVVDRDLSHVYQPGLLFVPFGDYAPEDIVRDRQRYLAPRVDLRLDPVDRVVPDAHVVRFEDGEELAYDLLIIATGSTTAPENVDGLTGEGWNSTAFDFYTLDGAVQLGRALENFEGGRVVVDITEMPIKCPVAPLEFAFLLDAFFVKRGMRDRAEIVFATPLDGAFTKPRASTMLGHLLEEKNIRVESQFALERVDGERRVIQGYDGREIDYDILVNIPLHRGSDIVDRSELGDDAAFVPTHRHELRSKKFDDIFIIGDATDLPASKAGSVAHFQSEVLTTNVMDVVAGREPSASFDGHSNCFIETGFDKAMLIDFNYETEPHPGRYPLPGIGPFTLLEESHSNHWGKLAFKWAYWNLLLRGKDLPIGHQMSTAGKWM